ncbi:MAG TPA: phenylalanine--tRNA ligase subunit beta [Microbacteriaceae bacterium]
MRVPISWLREAVDVPQGATPADVHAALVKVGFEEEDIHSFGVSGPIVVGQVLSAVPEPQTNGKTISWCQVLVGAEPRDVRGIVCGAHNFSAGDKVVVTLPGSVLPGPFPIAARKTYGHVSDGMIASVRELGIGDEHDGILRLATLGLDPEVGTDAIGLLGLDDSAVEINVTPDRGYALSIRGVAREYSHSTSAAFRDPALAVPAVTVTDEFPIVVDDAAPIRGHVGASVFVTRVVRGIDPSRPTPSWMSARLKLAGIRSISLVVDITNYVMVELGQPLHGYDLAKLTGGITVRRAAAGETLTTLDGQTRRLDAQDLLITDDSGPIGLAGVMGGEATEISTATTDVLIEAANFDPVSIARTARRHKLPSEASRRFERGVDPAVAAPAAARALQLLVELAGGTADTLGSDYDTSERATPIALADGYVSSLVGVPYSADDITATLTTIGADVRRDGDGFLVTPPTWRPDLRDQADLAEEVARIIGYDRIPSVLPVAPPGRGLSRAQRLRRAVSNALAAAGLTEVLSYPFVSGEANERFGAPEGSAPAMRLANPLDATTPYLRRSLIPGLVAVAGRNLSRGLTDLALYEQGSVFQPAPDETYGSGALPSGSSRPSDAKLAELENSIPPQPLHLGALFLGHTAGKQPGSAAIDAGLADALQVVRQVANAVGAHIDIVQGHHQALHPGRTAELRLNGRPVGFAGELLPALSESHDLPRRVAVVELDLGAIIDLAPREVVSSPIASLPAATQDLSLVVGVEVPAGDVLDAVVTGAGELLESARLIDDYRGPGVPQDAKSLTFALRFRAADRTLTAAEASGAKLAGAELAGARFGATVRE